MQTRKRRTRAEVVAQIIERCLIAVIRADKPEQVLPICEALVAGEITIIEITLTVPNAIDLIREARAKFDQNVLVGAGTVLNADGCRTAIQVGAEFVVTPVLRPGLIAIAHDRDTPIMLGAYSPTEAWNAQEAGADFVKLFPADKLGPGYVRSLRAPMPTLRVVPTGGVDLQTVGEFLRAGCVALGVGSALLTRDIVAGSKWGELTSLAQKFVEAVTEARKQ
jgi:2-dehydro-3-deoxyphosphogluconate aldolase / (4S)-4-hydroxy-2-oxoglutarate aldolase